MTQACDPIEEEMEMHRAMLRESRAQAEEIVRDRGWSERDEDFEIQVEQEAKEQWSLMWDAMHERERERWEEERREEETAGEDKNKPPVSTRDSS